MTNEERNALVERLREAADEYDSGHHESWPTIDAYNQAADQIEADGKRIAELEALLADESEMLTIAWMDGAHQTKVTWREAVKAKEARIATLESLVSELSSRALHEGGCHVYIDKPCTCGLGELIEKASNG